ncbi:hypothetical protein L1987_76438 [Smallanthus sonchifolius]|uniref:Uncharacterized protein n=1 Tax=Smallanthus sonchifolius TaxID=185202 RepID=A0ACB8Z880_9ASTR|nr:hypothetical protein L1987_76438 [Smallanthus sonchifolius]
MANKNLCIFILVATFVAQATWVRAKEWAVGDDKGWTPGVDYDAWVQGKDFYPGDSFVFQYEWTKHNVVFFPKEEDYQNCNLASVETLTACGRNVITLNWAAEFRWASAIGDDCKNGMKLKFTIKPAPPALEAFKVENFECAIDYVSFIIHNLGHITTVVLHELTEEELQELRHKDKKDAIQEEEHNEKEDVVLKLYEAEDEENHINIKNKILGWIHLKRKKKRTLNIVNDF